MTPRTVSDFPVGSRVRVLPIQESADPVYAGIVGLLGTVTAHDAPYLDVVIEGHRASPYDEGWLLLPDEVEIAS